MQGCIKTATQSRCTMQRHKWLSLHRCNGTNGCRCTDVATQTADEARCETNRAFINVQRMRDSGRTKSAQGCIKTATQSRCTMQRLCVAVDAQMQRHKWLSMHRCNGTNGCRCTDVATQMADEARMLTSNNLYNF